MGLLKSKYSTCLCKYTFQIRFRRGVVNLRLRRWRHCQSTSNIDIPSSYGTCARFPPYKHQSVESVVLHVYTSVESFRTFIDRTAAENILHGCVATACESFLKQAGVSTVRIDGHSQFDFSRGRPHASLLSLSFLQLLSIEAAKHVSKILCKP